MRDFLRRWGGPGVTFFIGLGFELIPPIESTPFATIAWTVAALWASYALWPTLKRWRPFTLAPAETEQGRSEGTSPETTPRRPQTIQAGSIGNIGHVENLHIVAAPREQEPREEHEPDADDELDYQTRPHFKDEAVYLPLFALLLEDIYVRDRTFTNCRIYGPALIVPSLPSTYEDTFLDNCTFYGDADAILWPTTEGRSGYMGLIAFEGCVFDRCDFFRVGLLVKERDYPIWLEHWQEQQRDLEEGADESAGELPAGEEHPSR